ncbi:hypothetical protein N656DRAFT_463990 [Canariomyces notabilis]|uniref:Uncharacterized protein n=1 Tax=Canariomyces notabilis TaxID=2074819 RepID=A0AAN6T8H0_9PEZI|nr:hypothetical protein N656DRAFT_463990 [Canariomyces arenarius]
MLNQQTDGRSLDCHTSYNRASRCVSLSNRYESIRPRWTQAKHSSIGLSVLCYCILTHLLTTYWISAYYLATYSK